MTWQVPSMNMAHYINMIVDFLPFVIYTGLLGKMLMCWRSLKVLDEKSRSPLAAIMLLACIVIVLFLVSNVYALSVYGKTFLSIRVFQMFVLGNCIVYWLLIDLLVRNARKQGKMREGNSSELAG